MAQVMKKIKREWRTVQIPDGLIDQIEEYIKTEEAKRRGFTSISAYVSYALRKELEK